MTSLPPRGPYSEEELEKLYPKGLQLQLVQIVRSKLHARNTFNLELSPRMALT